MLRFVDPAWAVGRACCAAPARRRDHRAARDRQPRPANLRRRRRGGPRHRSPTRRRSRSRTRTSRRASGSSPWSPSASGSPARCTTASPRSSATSTRSPRLSTSTSPPAGSTRPGSSSAELAGAARSVYVDVREAILGLRSPIEPGAGLVGAVEEYTPAVRRRLEARGRGRSDAGCPGGDPLAGGGGPGVPHRPGVPHERPQARRGASRHADARRGRRHARHPGRRRRPGVRAVGRRRRAAGPTTGSRRCANAPRRSAARSSGRRGRTPERWCGSPVPVAAGSRDRPRGATA